MSELPDQAVLWEQKHNSEEHEQLRGVPSPFAKLAVEYFTGHSHILELGCGVARDAWFFAERGHIVLATDASPIVIAQDKERSAAPNVDFAVLDFKLGFPYERESFDVVFANLALHYFFKDDTKNIVKGIVKILKPDGILAFACKSRDNQRTKDAKEIAPNLFVDPKGHALRLFSKEFATELTQDDFEIEHLDEVEEVYMGRVSSIVRCIARKK